MRLDLAGRGQIHYQDQELSKEGVCVGEEGLSGGLDGGYPGGDSTL
jgi:hypothetical protein